MLWSASKIQGYAIQASDGEIGIASELVFADVDWSIPWVVVDAGEGLSSREVLIPTPLLRQPDLDDRHLSVSMTLSRAGKSPLYKSGHPISRQVEAELFKYYELLKPRVGKGASHAIPAGVALAAEPFCGHPSGEDANEFETDGSDRHLHGLLGISGFTIEAKDGFIGHAEDFLVDAEHWKVRYVVVHTSDWWVGQKVLMSPLSVTAVDWVRSIIHVNATRDMIKGSPSFNSIETIDSAYDDTFLSYYGIRLVKK